MKTLCVLAIFLSQWLSHEVVSFTSTNRCVIQSSFLSRSKLTKISYKYENHNSNVVTMAAEFDWKGLKKKTDDAMKKSVDALGGSFNTLRAGGANPAILDRVMVDNYGSMVPLNSIARVGNQGLQTLQFAISHTVLIQL